MELNCISVLVYCDRYSDVKGYMENGMSIGIAGNKSFKVPVYMFEPIHALWPVSRTCHLGKPT